MKRRRDRKAEEQRDRQSCLIITLTKATRRNGQTDERTEEDTDTVSKVELLWARQICCLHACLCALFSLENLRARAFKGLRENV